jgi:hypothetical protein
MAVAAERTKRIRLGHGGADEGADAAQLRADSQVRDAQVPGHSGQHGAVPELLAVLKDRMAEEREKAQARAGKDYQELQKTF